MTLEVVTPRFGEDVETAAYFVVSEALQNATRHAPGAQIQIHVTFAHDELAILVRDNGPGGADIHKGSGLCGLSDRVTVIGGVLTVQSPPGQGTTVEARIPAMPLDAASLDPASLDPASLDPASLDAASLDPAE